MRIQKTQDLEKNLIDILQEDEEVDLLEELDLKEGDRGTVDQRKQ